MNLTAQILGQCVTKTQALRLLEDWEDLVRGNLFGGKKNTEIPKGLTKENYREEFGKAKAELAKVEPLYLYLPIELEEKELKKIVVKLREDYGKNFLLEPKFQGDLIGGCAMSYNGIYKDYSLHNKIVQNREKIRELMNKLLWK